MSRNLRRAVVQILMAVTLALSAIVALPLANKVSQQRGEQAAKAAPRGKVDGGELFTAAIYRHLVTVIGCLALPLVVGFTANKMLPEADEPPRSRRRAGR
jgi:hypothetical protein